ncbi:hypothetical protein GCM10022252_73310 [Streptosporangium oxazolinicum]|uniref:Uncharacterized protein n=1 Tax=Streptosporangium oxazolinicum TaxID=909287 RepID=A0ABP8BJS8_9ACTN
MNKPSVPVLDRTTASGCACFADARSHRRARTTARAHAHGAPPPNIGQPTTLLPDSPGPQNQTLRPGPAVAPGRGHSPDAYLRSSRWEATA